MNLLQMLVDSINTIYTKFLKEEAQNMIDEYENSEEEDENE